MEHISDIDEIIAKALTGEIAPEEQVWFENWLEKSPDNLLYFKQMQQLWTKSDLAQAPLPRPLDVEAALARTKTRIQTKPAPAKVIRMNYWQYGIAATLLLLVGAFWFFQQDAVDSTAQFASAENTIQDTLSDGSRIAINQHSSISATFSKKSRRVKMSGEAYFEVAPDPEKPFIIEVREVEVTVVGTKFNIDNRSDPDWVIVSVEEGKVRVKSGTQTEYLTAGQQARVNGKNGTFERTQTKPSGNISAWANRQFEFDDTPLSEVIPMLEKTYKVKINLVNKDLAQCRLHVRLNNESIEKIMTLIAETFSLEIRTENGAYFLDGAGCDR